MCTGTEGMVVQVELQVNALILLSCVPTSVVNCVP